jgi:periplasmic copper chaperone A
VGHGCKGSATTGLHVMLPEGFRGARPIVKPGWAINAPNVRLTQPYQSHGKPVDEDVNTVTFNGGPLRDAYYDEFVIFGKLPDAPSKLYFNVLHQCAVGSSLLNATQN